MTAINDGVSYAELRVNFLDKYDFFLHDEMPADVGLD